MASSTQYDPEGRVRSKNPCDVIPVALATTFCGSGDGTLEGMSEGGSEITCSSDVGVIVMVGSSVPGVVAGGSLVPGEAGAIDGLNSVEGVSVSVGPSLPILGEPLGCSLSMKIVGTVDGASDASPTGMEDGMSDASSSLGADVGVVVPSPVGAGDDVGPEIAGA